MSKLTGLPREKGEETDRKFIEALARGLDVLRAFQPGDGFLGNQEISARTGLPRSSVSRITYTLTKLGYLSYSERLEKYQLDSGVLALGYAFISNLAIRRIAQPMMQQLANTTDTAVGLASRDRLDMIYVEYCAPADVMTFRSEIGDRIPLATSAIGRAYFAALPPSEREYFLTHVKDKSGADWPDIQSRLLAAVEFYQRHGFCCVIGEWNRDVNGVAVPLIMNQGNIFSFNCGGPAYRLKEDYLQQEVAPQLKNMVRNIEATLIQY
ncbi:IclR family transcriptional regulator [Exilibacterium tricleocarpae]|uniref:IclR family transcriptional regulator n=1 Tax=Exilibacterium tricleocarpae TaxID=2591008 RepID=A0A545U3H0_9GAMM|nr:IclR family transcriptional regulator [Exilibacterium tricleocarpae]TQV84008.1 IclR family transcriptional regulator [Exilibacterium tricleocarpae]